MAARKYFTAELQDEAGQVLATTTRYAMNSTIRMSEQLVREHARAIGTAFTGDRPNREGDVYQRRWVGDDGSVIIATASRWL